MNPKFRDTCKTFELRGALLDLVTNKKRNKKENNDDYKKFSECSKEMNIYTTKKGPKTMKIKCAKAL